MSSAFHLSFRCDVPWESMEELAPGKRHCGQCEREVIDISALTRKAAERLVKRQPNLCINYLARGDGTPVFRKAPAAPGLAAIASMMLAACSPEERPSCELSPEPALVDGPAEHLLGEAETTSGPLDVPGAPVPLIVTNPVTNQLADTAEPGDPNDTDGVSPHPTRRRPHARRPGPGYIRTGGVMAVPDPPTPTSARDRNL